MLVMDVSRETPAYFIMATTQIIDENSHERRKMFASLTNKKSLQGGRDCIKGGSKLKKLTR